MEIKIKHGRASHVAFLRRFLLLLLLIRSLYNFIFTIDIKSSQKNNLLAINTLFLYILKICVQFIFDILRPTEVAWQSQKLEKQSTCVIHIFRLDFHLKNS